MGGVHKPGTNFGAPMPINTLNGNTQRHAHSAPPSSPHISRLSPPPTKRQKVESDAQSHAHHTHAQFVPSPDMPIGQDRPRKRSADSIHSVSDSQITVSVQSSNARQSQSNISEFRNSEKFVKPRAPKRPRHKAPDNQTNQLVGSSSMADKEDDIESISDHDMSAKGRPESSIPAQTHETQRGTTHSGNGTSRYKSSAVRIMRKAINKSDPKNKRTSSTDSSEDELANDDKEIAQKLPYKRQIMSSSVSRKNDIKPTKFSGTKMPSSKLRGPHDITLAKAILTSPLRIARGVSGSLKYQAAEKSEDEQCFLSLREISTLLHPTDKNGNIRDEYTYLQVNLTKVQSVLVSEEGCIVYISRSLEASASSAPKLLLEFSSREELDMFNQWITMKRHLSSLSRIDIKPCPVNKLRETFQKFMDWAERSTVRRDSDRAADAIGDDVKLIEYNTEARHREAQRGPRQADGPTSRPKLKDAMGSSSSVPLSLADHGHSAKTESLRQHLYENHAQAQRPARTTRAAFALRNSPEPTYPEFESWTSKNPGWESSWRNSLVFPAHGKNRAIVDKDDIHRLDEGQFLNDNLVIFYLRYLQDRLETERPDLARRIYFQNTFFYDKLKMAKSGHQINYDSVKAWTSKVDLFTKDYIIVPINEYTHWYVAIIYNAPKLLPSPREPTEFNAHQRDSITIEDDDAAATQDVPRQHGSTSDGPSSDLVAYNAQNEVIDHLSRMSITSSDNLTMETKKTADNRQGSGQDDTPSTECDKPVHLISGSDDSRGEIEQIQTLSGTQNRSKKTGKRHSTGSRKYNPGQTKIITLDSMGTSHSPTCSILKQYLVAELKDKKNIEITPPGALGMTAKGVPEQSNHWDCGLYLLGYIQEFLKDPDMFVHSILQHDDRIDWNLNPPKLRNSIRELIFRLQQKQQSLEDDARERKRQAAMLKKKDKPEGNGEAPRQHTINLESSSDDIAKPARVVEAHGPLVGGEHAVSKTAPSALKGNDEKMMTVEIGPITKPKGEHGNNVVPGLMPSPKDRTEGLEVAKAVPESIIPGENKTISMSKPQISEACSEPPQSPILIGSSKDPRIPGAFPASPARENGNKRARAPSTATDDSEEIQQAFIHPLASPRRTGTPTNPMLVEDLEAAFRRARGSTPEKTQVGSPKRAPIEVVLPSMRSLSGYQDIHVEPPTNNQSTSRSHYFAGRQRGDKMPSAKLREEPVENPVIDISD
ncbi:hypothetical protein F4775DRAFT_592780 [Biscogniauxia sp. FL1348]|nr:hypothetical protein F4775DRAFT_592780 [Biscogniauxia sp. FL1348]